MRPILYVALCAASACVCVGDAFACGFIGYGVPLKKEIHRKKPPPLAPSDRIARADGEVEIGAYAAALADISVVYPEITNVRAISASGDRLEIRAARAAALATVRKDDRARIEWATLVLRDIAKNARPDDPAAQADLGEALAKTPASRDEALSILEPLAKKDLIGSAFAYAALARLSNNAAYAARCADMTLTPEVCPAKPGA